MRTFRDIIDQTSLFQEMSHPLIYTENDSKLGSGTEFWPIRVGPSPTRATAVCINGGVC